MQIDGFRGKVMDRETGERDASNTGGLKELRFSRIKIANSNESDEFLWDGINV
jgi:hypothetical protein